MAMDVPRERVKVFPVYTSVFHGSAPEYKSTFFDAVNNLEKQMNDWLESNPVEVTRVVMDSTDAKDHVRATLVIVFYKTKRNLNDPKTS